MIFHVCSRETTEWSVLTGSDYPKTSHVTGCWWVSMPDDVICTNILKEILVLWSISLKAFPSSFCTPTKLDPLSLCKTLMFPLLEINRRIACMKESVSILQVHSICIALLDKHVKIALYFLSSFLPSFIRNEPKISTPQLVDGGPSNVLSFGRPAIFCLPSFPLSNRHLTHFPIRLLTIVLHRTTQKPLLLISFIVRPFHHATFLWYHSTINLGILPSFPSNTG